MNGYLMTKQIINNYFLTNFTKYQVQRKQKNIWKKQLTGVLTNLESIF